MTAPEFYRLLESAVDCVLIDRVDVVEALDDGALFVLDDGSEWWVTAVKQP